MSYPLLRRSVTITTANQAIRLNEGGVAYTALVAPGVYWVRNSGANSLNLAVVAAIEAITPANTYTLRPRSPCRMPSPPSPGRPGPQRFRLTLPRC